MNQQQIVDFFENYDCEIKRGNNPYKGISLHIIFDKVILSIQAGMGLYSVPDEIADDYSAYEIALMNKGGDFITKDYIDDAGDDVIARVSFDYILKVVNMINPSKKSSKSNSKNNDGRKECFWCGGKTKQINTGFNFYDVCEECGK